jgi:hypothetical protein
MTISATHDDVNGDDTCFEQLSRPREKENESRIDLEEIKDIPRNNKHSTSLPHSSPLPENNCYIETFMRM